MVVSTKYAIGDEVYAIYKDGSEINLFKDEIIEIVISKNEQTYYLKKHDCESWKEEELIEIRNERELIEKIEKLTGGQN